jgi:hypothetical protein
MSDNVESMSDNVELCPQCGHLMERVVINGHDSWACPIDASAYSVDQDDDDLWDYWG